MRFGNEIRFPHPVLSHFTGDYSNGDFSLGLGYLPNDKTNVPTLTYKLNASEDSIKDLIRKGSIKTGVYVFCSNTHYSKLIELPLNGNKFEFQQGSLEGKVIATGLAWIPNAYAAETQGITIKSPNLHAEFGQSFCFEPRAIVALDEPFEFTVSVGRLPSTEAVFKLEKNETDSERIEVSLRAHDRITIILGSNLYDGIMQLRATGKFGLELYNAIYVPAIMELLLKLHVDGELHSEKKWYKAIMDRCQRVGVDPAEASGGQLLEAAQRLLDFPIKMLSEKLEINDESE